jgi:hypothetical protein
LLHGNNGIVFVGICCGLKILVVFLHMTEDAILFIFLQILILQESLGNITKPLDKRKDLIYGKSTCSTKQWTLASKT